MISNEKSTYDSIVREMGNEEAFKYFNAKQVTNTVTLKELTDLCSKPKNIKFEGDVLSVFVKDGDVEDWKIMQDGELGVQDCGKWLSEVIVDPQFDITQDGNIRKAGEAEAAYICCIIVGILNDKNFKFEFEQVALKYDYSKMAAIDPYRPAFKDILEEWQKLNSFIINVIVSACKRRISEQKKDAEKFLRDGLTEEQLIGLKDLQANISRIIYGYTGPRGPLNPDNLVLNKLKKVDILKLLDEQYLKIEDLVEESDYGTIYRIFNLSTEYINPIAKKNLKYIVLDKTEKYYKESVEAKETDKDIFVKKLNARVLKTERTSIRRAEILKYIANPETYSLPSKL